MHDQEIVELYWDRNETAIVETDRKYGKYFHTIAYNILYSNEDAEECVNDTYLKAWETMPPEKPNCLSAYLGRITRNIALNRYTKNHAEKRNIQLTAVYDEAAAVSADRTDMVDELILRDTINAFLASLSKEHRVIFMRRYWYASTVADIAKDYRIPEGTVKSILARTRIKFKKFLEKEGIEV